MPNIRALFLFTLLIPLTAHAAGTVATCTETAFKTALSGGGTVTFSCSGTITLTSEAVVSVNTVIDGSGQSVILSGNNAVRILRLVSTSANPRSLTVRNLTLANGSAARGGAITVEHQGQLTIENVTFSGNVAPDGGSAIYNGFESTLSVTDSRFLNNDASAGNDERGATIAIIGPGPLTVQNSEFINNLGSNGVAINTINTALTIDNSRFTGNSALAAAVDSGQGNPTLRGYGGAVYTDRGTVVIRNSVFENNTARSAGGALALHVADQQSLTIENNTFRDNQAIGLVNGPKGSGGGVYIFGLEAGNLGLTLSGCLFAGNRAVNDAGGLRIHNVTATVSNSTFYDNRTTQPLTASYSGGIGGGMAIFGSNPVTISHVTFSRNYASWTGGAINGNSQTVVNRSIFDRNTADNGTNNWDIQFHTGCNLSGSNNLQFPSNGKSCADVTSGATMADALLLALADNGGPTWTMALPANSPALDVTSSDCAPVDQRGIARVLPCDLGAFERVITNNSVLFQDGFEP